MSFQGSLKELRLPDIIQLVSVTGKTGAFHLKRESEAGRIWLQKGEIVHAELRELRGENALYALAIWADGAFNFFPDEAAPERTITKSNTNLLMESARRLDEWKILQRKVPNTKMVPKFVIPEQPNRQISLNTREWQVVSKIDEHRSIDDISVACSLSVFDVSKILYGLISSNLVALAKEAPPEKEKPAESPGTLPERERLINMVDRMRDVATSILGEIGEPVIAKQHAKARGEILKGGGLDVVIEACGQITKASSVLRGPSATKMLLEKLEEIYAPPGDDQKK
ncbi:MAG: DUF4388 domain-containing protein [Acidobacteriota bacterium]